MSRKKGKRETMKEGCPGKFQMGRRWKDVRLEIEREDGRERRRLEGDEKVKQEKGGASNPRSLSEKPISHPFVEVETK